MWHKRKYSYEKVLRIGILHNNKMVQERLLMPDNSFSIGTHLGSDFIIQGIENHTLFYTKKGKYYIRGSHDLSGKILHKDKSIQNMISKETELSFFDKGKINIGTHCIIFQFIDAPPLAMFDQYSKSNPIDYDDQMFLSFTILNVVCAAVLLIYSNFFFQKPIEPPKSREALIATILQDSFTEPLPQPIEEPPNDLLNKEPTPKKPKRKVPKKTPKESKTASSSPKEPTKDITIDSIKSAQEELDRSIAVIATINDQNNSLNVITDAYNSRSIDAEVDNIDYTASSSSKISIRHTNILDKESKIKIAKIPTKDQEIVVRKGPKSRVAQPRIQNESKEVVSKSSCAVEVKKVFKKERSKIIYCYSREVKKHPSLSGTLSISLKINSGKNHVKFLSDTLNSNNLKKCITRRMKKWKFSPSCNGSYVQKNYVLQVD